MPYKSFRRSTKRVFKRRAFAKKVYKKRVPTRAIKAVVNKALKRNIELKHAPLYTLADQVQVTGAGLNTGSSLGYCPNVSIIPPVTQGTGDGQRVGNIIHPKKLTLRYTLRAGAINSSNNFTATPFLARVIVFKHRYAIDDNSQLLLLDSGNGAQNLGSTPDDWTKPYNRKEFEILYSKQFLMQPIRNELTTPISSENVANGTKTFVSRVVSLPIKNRYYVYSDTNTTPSNAGYFVAFCVCNCDGTVVLSTSTRMMVNCETVLSYTDA